MLVFVSGSYRSSEENGVDKNIEAARTVGIALWEAGHVAFVPHLNTAHFEEDCNAGDVAYLAGDLTAAKPDLDTLDEAGLAALLDARLDGVLAR